MPTAAPMISELGMLKRNARPKRCNGTATNARYNSAPMRFVPVSSRRLPVGALHASMQAEARRTKGCLPRVLRAFVGEKIDPVPA